MNHVIVKSVHLYRSIAKYWQRRLGIRGHILNYVGVISYLIPKPELSFTAVVNLDNIFSLDEYSYNASSLKQV